MPRRVSLLLAFAAVAAFALGACNAAPAAPPLTDPNEILTKSVAAMTQAKTAHFTAVVTGSFNADLMGTGQTSEFSLDGTTLEGDIDVPGKKMRASFSVPALLGLSGELIQIGQTSYVKTTLTGPLFQKQVSEELPVEQVTDPAQAAEAIRTVLEMPGVSPTKIDDAKCGDNKDCYQVQIALTPEEIAALASEAPSMGADLENASLSVTFGVEKDTLRMSRLVVSVSMGAQGSLDLTLDMSKWDEAVTVNEPPADQVGG